MNLLAQLTAAVDALPADKRPVASISANAFNKVIIRVQWVSSLGHLRDASERVDRADVADDAALLKLVERVCAKAREEMK